MTYSNHNIVSLLFAALLVSSNCSYSADNVSIIITQATVEHTYQMKDIVLKTTQEFNVFSDKSTQELIKMIDANDELQDNDYKAPKGIFLVAIHKNIVIGMGAIKYLSDEVCELKRVFFKPEYRNKGLGKQLVNELLKYAQFYGYKKIVLDVYNTQTQKNAVHLYKTLGFYQILPYKDFPAQLFMQKDLV